MTDYNNVLDDMVKLTAQGRYASSKEGAVQAALTLGSMIAGLDAQTARQLLIAALRRLSE